MKVRNYTENLPHGHDWKWNHAPSTSYKKKYPTLHHPLLIHGSHRPVLWQTFVLINSSYSPPALTPLLRHSALVNPLIPQTLPRLHPPTHLFTIHHPFLHSVGAPLSWSERSPRPEVWEPLHHHATRATYPIWRGECTPSLAPWTPPQHWLSSDLDQLWRMVGHPPFK